MHNPAHALLADMRKRTEVFVFKPLNSETVHAVKATIEASLRDWLLQYFPDVEPFPVEVKKDDAGMVAIEFNDVPSPIREMFIDAGIKVNLVRPDGTPSPAPSSRSRTPENIAAALKREADSCYLFGLLLGMTFADEVTEDIALDTFEILGRPTAAVFETTFNAKAITETAERIPWVSVERREQVIALLEIVRTLASQGASK